MLKDVDISSKNHSATHKQLKGFLFAVLLDIFLFLEWIVQKMIFKGERQFNYNWCI